MSNYVNSSHISRSKPKSLGTKPVGNLRSKGLDDTQSPKFKEIDTALAKLRPYEKTLKIGLPKSANDDFKTITTSVNLFRNTDYYEKLKEKIINTFKNGPYALGTIGAYFMNCMDSTLRGTCNPSCIGNLILNDGSEDICRYASFSLDREDGSSGKFIPLNKNNGIVDFEKIIIYVKNMKPSFDGFTSGEIAFLENIGAKDVEVVEYDTKNVSKARILTKDFVKVSTFRPVVRRKMKNNNDNALSCLFFLVLFILIILLVCGRPR